MSTTQKRAALLGILTALLGAVTMPLLRTVWDAKVSSSDFRLYTQTVDSKLERLAVQDSMQREMLTDILCSVKPRDRRCQ